MSKKPAAFTQKTLTITSNKIRFKLKSTTVENIKCMDADIILMTNEKLRKSDLITWKIHFFKESRGTLTVIDYLSIAEGQSHVFL